MSFIKKNIYKLILPAFAFLLPILSFAQTAGNECDPKLGKICNPISYKTLEAFIKAILEGVIKIGIPIIALAIIYCGFLFVFARGNSEKLKTAKSSLMYTLIGAAILLGAWAIAQLISETILAL